MVVAMPLNTNPANNNAIKPVRLDARAGDAMVVTMLQQSSIATHGCANVQRGMQTEDFTAPRYALVLEECK